MRDATRGSSAIRPASVAAVWVGFDDNAPHGLSGSAAALPIWTQFMKQALDAYPAPAFTVPAGITTANIDTSNGRLAGESCRRSRPRQFPHRNQARAVHRAQRHHVPRRVVVEPGPRLVQALIRPGALASWAVALALTGCATGPALVKAPPTEMPAPQPAPAPAPKVTPRPAETTGTASWYGKAHRRPTNSQRRDL